LGGAIKNGKVVNFHLGTDYGALCALPLDAQVFDVVNYWPPAVVESDYQCDPNNILEKEFCNEN